jgi:hypothetical protein
MLLAEPLIVVSFYQWTAMRSNHFILCFWVFEGFMHLSLWVFCEIFLINVRYATPWFLFILDKLDPHVVGLS